MVCKVLDLNKPVNGEGDTLYDRKIKMFENLKDLTKELSSTYITQEGTNAYAFFNVLTDIVSHQDEYQNLATYDLHPGNCYLQTCYLG